MRRLDSLEVIERLRGKIVLLEITRTVAGDGTYLCSSRTWRATVSRSPRAPRFRTSWKFCGRRSAPLAVESTAALELIIQCLLGHIFPDPTASSLRSQLDMRGVHSQYTNLCAWC